jgi:hypothetical protein
MQTDLQLDDRARSVEPHRFSIHVHPAHGSRLPHFFDEPVEIPALVVEPISVLRGTAQRARGIELQRTAMVALILGSEQCADKIEFDHARLPFRGQV